jgi:hypothetical protein
MLKSIGLKTISSGIYLFLKVYLIFALTYLLWHFLLKPAPLAPNSVPDASATTGFIEPLKESFEDSAGSPRGSVSFMPAKTTAEFLLNDKDRYIQTMSKSDLAARKVVCQEAYRLNAYFASKDFTADEQALLEKATADADAFFERYIPKPITGGKGSAGADLNSINVVAYFDARKAKAIPWKFMLVDDVYEEGLPHTRDEYIFLSPEVLKYGYSDLVETLIHEKIHLYQRKYQREKTYLDYDKTEVFLTDYMLSKMNYVRVKRRTESACDIRANPDLDEWIYRDPKESREMILCYKSSQPSGITDVIGDPKDEHPFERIAYEFGLLYRKIAS